ncbi:MAG: hypothetical protein IPP02_10560 [Chitinophagaceae bacterium]|jgi:predicted component of type VI protein secretion system|nr:hypothetical protein [Chitinophagaceae bacterium]MBK7680290.1 hypothetical protein [Chitinophagaceae bacterium]MBK8301722.1 hypothetical protein [Chitinophagaceae bacterium]MBK9466280.1 hypothetical protein [Chitinophagaceae bacterium]MBK9661211.1 hypothetical protein [Chitinophagaceae bacterium]
MRKIKHISDLKEEKMRLRIKQLELERELRLSWNDLKNNLDPKTLLKNKIADITHHDSNKEDLLGSTINHVAGYLTRQLVTTVVDKLVHK